jgi:hypothetical protein
LESIDPNSAMAKHQMMQHQQREEQQTTDYYFELLTPPIITSFSCPLIVNLPYKRTQREEKLAFDSLSHSTRPSFLLRSSFFGPGACRKWTFAMIVVIVGLLVSITWIILKQNSDDADYSMS